MSSRARSNPIAYLGALAFTLAELTTACRGHLPPTEPRRAAGETMSTTSSDDAPGLGPLASLDVAAGSGGTSVLPSPPPGPGGGGVGGAAGGVGR